MRAALILVLTSCALTSRSAPLELEYYTPDAPASPAVSSRVVSDRAPRVRLGRVSLPLDMREQIFARTSAVELLKYDHRRWTDAPDVFVRSALRRALFERGALTEAATGVALRLEIDVIAFEERRVPYLAGHVRLAYRIIDEGDVVSRGIVDVARPACTAAFDAVVIAIGAALDEASTRVARAVETAAGSESANAPLVTQRACVAPTVH